MNYRYHSDKESEIIIRLCNYIDLIGDIIWAIAISLLLLRLISAY